MKLDHDSMSQRERLVTLMEHQEPDRIPFFLMGMPEYSDFFQEFLAREDNLLDPYTENEENLIFTPCGDYTREVFFGADIVTNGAKTEPIKKVWIDDQGKITDHGTIVNGIETGSYVDRSGRLMKIEILPNGYPYSWYQGGFLKTAEEIENWFDTYGWPHELKVFPMDSAFRETNQQFQDKLLMIGGTYPGLFEFSWFMMGQARFAFHCRKNPDLIRKIINSVKEFQIKQIQTFKAVDAIAIFNSDDMGQKGRSILSQNLHKKFYSAARKEINDAIHDIGAYSIQHSCGNIVELLPELIDCGTDAWQTLEPASEIDNTMIKKKFGDQISFWGAIDNNILCFGTPQEVEGAVKQTIAELGKGGGFVIGPSHDYLNTKVDLALALRDASIKYGKYALSLQ